LLVGVPIPEQYRAEGENIQKVVEQAILEADANGMSKRGKEVTPWLLSRVGELTQGKSLRSSMYCMAPSAKRSADHNIFRCSIDRKHGGGGRTDSGRILPIGSFAI